MSLQNIWCRIVALTIYSDLHATRFVIALTELSCAALLLLVGNALEFPSYSIMRDIMSDKAWAFLFLVMGTTQFSILSIGNYHTKFAVWFAGINQSIWWFIVISMLVSHAHPPLAFAAYFSIATVSTLVWVRSGHNTDRRAKPR